MYPLQWGRVLKDAEIFTIVPVCPTQRMASMGPRLEGRGNGAGRRSGTDGSGASMGPRLEGRGNWPPPVSFCSRRPRLQWGRVLKDAEIGYPDDPSDAGLHASMGPRLEGRGNPRNQPAPAAAPIASMGPRLEGRGNPPTIAWWSCVRWLQWGRVLKDAEILSKPRTA